MKVCSGCRRDLPLDAFYRREGAPIARCKDCTRAAVRAYITAPEGKAARIAREKAPEWREARKAKRIKYKEREAEDRRLYALRPGHSERNAERHRRYQATEHGKMLKRLAEARRRAARRAVAGSVSREDVAEIYKLQRGRCAICRKTVGKDYEVDHIQPLAKGGQHERRNVQITCQPCNGSKKDRDPIDHMRRRGLLL